MNAWQDFCKSGIVMIRRLKCKKKSKRNLNMKELGAKNKEQWTQGGVRGAGNTQRSMQTVNTGTNKF